MWVIFLSIFLLLVLFFSIFFFVLLQNLLFYYENEESARPSGLIFLEGCYCERLVSGPLCLGPLSNTAAQNAAKLNKEEKLQVS